MAELSEAAFIPQRHVEPKSLLLHFTKKDEKKERSEKERRVFSSVQIQYIGTELHWFQCSSVLIGSVSFGLVWFYTVKSSSILFGLFSSSSILLSLNQFRFSPSSVQ